jgi:hypothetical protein
MHLHGCRLESLFEERVFSETILYYIVHFVILTYCVVGVATTYGLEGPGFGFQWVRDFPDLFRPAPTSLLNKV